MASSMFVAGIDGLQQVVTPIRHAASADLGAESRKKLAHPKSGRRRLLFDSDDTPPRCGNQGEMVPVVKPFFADKCLKSYAQGGRRCIFCQDCSPKTRKSILRGDAAWRKVLRRGETVQPKRTIQMSFPVGSFASRFAKQCNVSQSGAMRIMSSVVDLPVAENIAHKEFHEQIRLINLHFEIGIDGIRCKDVERTRAVARMRARCINNPPYSFFRPDAEFVQHARTWF